MGSGREEEGQGGSFGYRSLGNETTIEAPNAVRMQISEVETE